MRVNCKIIFCFFISFLFSSSVFAENSKNFRVMTYNINALPSPVKTEKKVLLQYIAQKINESDAIGSAPDVIVIQEAFVKASLKYFIDKVNYPYILSGPNQSDRGHIILDPKDYYKRPESGEQIRYKWYGGGLYLLSKHPIIHAELITFDDYCSGADCLVNKGAVFARIQPKDVPYAIDILTTHMNATNKQAGKPEKVVWAKKNQSRVIAEFMDNFRNKDLPLIIAGDVNLFPGKEVYNLFMEFIDSSNVGEYCLQEESCHIARVNSEDEIFLTTNDQHFIQQSRRRSFDIEPVYAHRGMREVVPGDSKGRPASDHLSYEVIYKLKW